MSRSGALPAGTLVLDSEGLSMMVGRDSRIGGWLSLARDDDLRVVISAATLVEVVRPGLKRAALDWTLSRLTVVPVSEHVALRAAALLHEAGFRGHRYAIDAIVAATALSSPGPVTVLTSDVDDLQRLCGLDVDVLAL